MDSMCGDQDDIRDDGIDYEPFITGSRRYGTPNEKSDIDMVILCRSKDAYELLVAQADNKNDAIKWGRYDTMTTKALRFGKLNLLVTKHPATYRHWYEITEKLVMVASVVAVTKDQAIKAFDWKNWEEQYAN